MGIRILKTDHCKKKLPSSWPDPGPLGHSSKNSLDPTAGHGRHGLPQAGVIAPRLAQQQADFVTTIEDGLLHSPLL